MGEKANAGRFERGCLKVTTDNLTSWTLSRRETPPETFFRGALMFMEEITMEHNEEKLAVLIDAENVPNKPMDELFQEIAKFGDVAVKRI